MSNAVELQTLCRDVLEEDDSPAYRFTPDGVWEKEIQSSW